MPSDNPSNSSSNKNISIGGDVSGIVTVGDNNVVNKQTIFQKFINIFKSDAETLEQRNRRTLLNHVETAWIKGVLDASLHGAALLDLGIKENPDAVKTYPWTLKKESTDETLPAGTSMLEIFDSIGMGRSLLILGAPGSGKTTMLLELARGLIARAREDITQPIPMVFNLASWTEKLSLTDWLAQELNNLYSVPRKTAPDWVKGNKLLLLLDGLDEVRQESRARCVEAINEFRKQNGLTSLAVCSRSQDYVDLKAKLTFEGAIEVQPLTQEQIAEFFNRFGDEITGIKQAFEKDSTLREMAETPLFLSIMILAYRDKQEIDFLISGDEKARRKHLFDTYTQRMFERPRLKSTIFKKQDVLHWLSWIARKMIRNNQTPLLTERIQPNWLEKISQWRNYRLLLTFTTIVLQGLCLYLLSFLSNLIQQTTFVSAAKVILALPFYVILLGAASFQIFLSIKVAQNARSNIDTEESLDSQFKFSNFVDKIKNKLSGGKSYQNYKRQDKEKKRTNRIKSELIEPVMKVINSNIETTGKILIVWQSIRYFLLPSIILGILLRFVINYDSFINKGNLFENWFSVLGSETIIGAISGLFCFGPLFLFVGLTTPKTKAIVGLQIQTTSKPNEGISLSFFYWLTTWIGISLLSLFYFWLLFIVVNAGKTPSLPTLAEFSFVLEGAISIGLLISLLYGGFAVIQHYTLRLILTRNNLLPWRLVPFLDHCVDLIFLRRVGGGYIFIHRLLMEHFAEMYVESPTSKGN